MEDGIYKNTYFDSIDNFREPGKYTIQNVASLKNPPYDKGTPGIAFLDVIGVSGGAFKVCLQKITYCHVNDARHDIYMRMIFIDNVGMWGHLQM